MEWWLYPLMAGLGVVAGTLNVIAGGGSLITVPTMIACGIDSSMANGTNRVAIMGQNLAAITSFRRQGWAEWGLSLRLGLLTLPGAVAGAWLGAVVRDALFNLVLAGVMVLVLLTQLRRPTACVTAEEGVRRPLLGTLAMLGIGFYGGFIQAGVGFLLIGALRLACGPSLVRANMHKVFIVACYMPVSLAVFAWQGQVLWLLGLALACGNACGGWLGARLSVRKGDRFIAVVLNSALLVLIAVLVAKSLG